VDVVADDNLSTEWSRANGGRFRFDGETVSPSGSRVGVSGFFDPITKLVETSWGH